MDASAVYCVDFVNVFIHSFMNDESHTTTSTFLLKVSVVYDKIFG